MKSGPFSPFHYNFRVPGRQVEGPIRYAVGQTVHGMVLVGRSRQGVCAIFLGENAQDLYEQLAGAFPDVELMADQQSLLGELGQVVAFIDKGTLRASSIWTSEAPLSNRKSGDHCVPFREVRRAATARSHNISAYPRPFDL